MAFLGTPLFAAFVLVAGQLAFPEAIDRSVERLMGGADTMRLEIWSATGELLAKKPLGVGLTGAHFADELNRIRPGFFVANPHSVLLTLPVHLGVIGMVLMLYILGLGLVQGTSCLRDDSRRRGDTSLSSRSPGSCISCRRAN